MRVKGGIVRNQFVNWDGEMADVIHLWPSVFDVKYPKDKATGIETRAYRIDEMDWRYICHFHVIQRAGPENTAFPPDPRRFFVLKDVEHYLEEIE